MMKLLPCSALAVASVLLASTVAQAQTSALANGAEAIELEQKALDDSDGVRAKYLLSEAVFGVDGDQIGKVQNAIVTGQGQLAALVVEISGVWNIRYTEIVVPWDKVKVIPNGFKVPIDQRNYKDYWPFGNKSFVTKETLQQIRPIADKVATGPETWKLTALLGDYVTLSDDSAYGYLEDVLFYPNGRIKAVIVRTTVPPYDHDPYAYPFYGHRYGWRPAGNVYPLPYGPNEVLARTPFGYGTFNGYWH